MLWESFSQLSWSILRSITALLRSWGSPPPSGTSGPRISPVPHGSASSSAGQALAESPTTESTVPQSPAFRVSDFDLAWEFTAKEEGVKKDAQGNILSTGLNTVAGDPGGTTNFGRSEEYNPDIDVTQLTWDTAKKRAFTNYWLPTGCTN